MSAQLTRTVPPRSAAAADASTFAPAMALLPDGIRADVESLYSVLRSIDDLVDEDDPRAAGRVDAVEEWVRSGLAQTRETRTLADLKARHPLMRDDALIQFCEGMRHDIARESINDDEGLMRYCQQAGGSVGEVLASILGAVCEQPAGRREVQAGIAVLGHAMQVTNILRDIDDDRAHGRIYIPHSMIERYGFPEPGRRQLLLGELIAQADALYERGEPAIPLLAAGREAMSLAASRYRAILRQIERDQMRGFR